MQIAIDVAGFTPAEADELRQAMSAKRSGARMARCATGSSPAWPSRGITGAVAEEICGKLAAFANFGFPESHAVSFAYLVYSSAWLKLHYPAAFCAGLLNAQPMGFWSPQSPRGRRPAPRGDGPPARTSTGPAPRPPSSRGPGRARRRGPVGVPDRQPAVRLGLVVGARHRVRRRPSGSPAGAPVRRMEDLVRRAGVGRAQLEALATAGALDGLPPAGARRPAGGPGAPAGPVWAAGAVAQATADRLPGLVTGEAPPPLPDLTPSRRWRPTCGPPA